MRWSGVGGEALVLQCAAVGIGPGAGRELLGSLAAPLSSAGHRFRVTRRRGLPVLEATSGRLHVTAEVGAGATVVTLRCALPPIPPSTPGPGPAPRRVPAPVRDQVCAELLAAARREAVR